MLIGSCYYLCRHASHSFDLFSVIMINFIFRVYDNAKANAEMQKAQLILSLQDSSSKRAVRKFLKYIQENCAPLKEYYDDEEETQANSLTKITHQIHVCNHHLAANTAADTINLTFMLC